MALACGVALSACSLSLDTERARRLLASSPQSGVPVLLEQPAAELPAPEELRALSGELRSVPLAWEPLLGMGVAGYAIERALTREGPYERVAAVAGEANSVFVDRGHDPAPKSGGEAAAADLGDAGSYFYRVRAFAPSGALASAVSEIATATTAPTPAPPGGLRAYSGEPRRTPLSWRPSPDPRVSGYVVYRSPSSHGPFEPIAEIDGRFATTWVDRGLGDLRVFYYRVSARNSAGGEGERSEPVRAVTKPEPLPPLGLRVTGQALGRNRVAWEPNVEPDLVRYRLLRLREGAEEPEVVSELASSQTYADDEAVEADERVAYTAIALDRDGLESAPAEPIEVASEGYALTATARPDGVHLEWRARADEGFQRARIVRAGLLGAVELGVSESGSFVDRDVEPGGRYRYVVVLERGDATRAPPSSPVEIRIPGD